MNYKNVLMWIGALVGGIIVGVCALPFEALFWFLAKTTGTNCYGERDDARFFGYVGFVFRQFTDISMLRQVYPLRKSHE